MSRDITIGLIGLGNRGISLLEQVMLPQKVCVAAVCDVYEDRREAAAKIITDAGQGEPLKTDDYRKILEMPRIDAVINTAAWETHVPIACEAMRAGKYIGFEVGGAYSLDDCWKLVHVYEETGVPCMMMENCCYGRNELLVLNMVRQGLFGEVVHCQGGYRHDLREEVSTGREKRHYRFRNYLNRNGENYPTHELGPICNVLDIGHGNRMVSLVSVASKAAGLREYMLSRKDEFPDAYDLHFTQGDVVNTIITCAHGETIAIALDTTLPRFYSRAFQVQGTKAMYMDDNHSIFMDGKDNADEFEWKKNWDNASLYYEQYDHPVWKTYQKIGVRGSHDGMDWLVFKAFFDAVREKRQTPIDVYDSAAMMAITPLSEQSISAGGMPVAIPDFTNGAWITRAKWEPGPEDW